MLTTLFEFLMFSINSGLLTFLTFLMLSISSTINSRRINRLTEDMDMMTDELLETLKEKLNDLILVDKRISKIEEKLDQLSKK